MSSSPASTKIKVSINALLRQLGLELITTRKQRLETARLTKLRAGGHWLAPRYEQGLDFRPAAQLQFLREAVRPYQHDFSLLCQEYRNGTEGFSLNNGYFESVDAEVLYAMLRHHIPRHIIEVGSGNSTRLMRQAIKDGGLQTHLTCIDPHPRVEMRQCADEFISAPLEETGAATALDSLAEGDILFIDSSHTVMTGGDVNFLFLEALPKLKPGVLIHIHDIFLPFDYPERWVVEERWGWNEQYLVHAFLAFNNIFEITWASRYMWEYHKDAVLSSMPNCPNNAMPSSLWLTKAQ